MSKSLAAWHASVGAGTNRFISRSSARIHPSGSAPFVTLHRSVYPLAHLPSARNGSQLPAYPRSCSHRTKSLRAVGGKHVVKASSATQAEPESVNLGSHQPLRLLLIPAGILAALSHLVDGKGVMLASYWCVRHFLPAVISLWVAKHARKHWNSLSACAVLAASYVLSAVAAQHLWTGPTNMLKLYNPLFQGVVTIPTSVSKWVTQSQATAANLTRTLAWGPWVLLTLGAALQLAVWVDPGARLRAKMVRARCSAHLLALVATHFTLQRSMRTVLFCSHKGGPGKTSLLSHTVSQYAHSHPDRKVLLIDCSVPADVTRQVLGGDHDFKGEENFDKVLELQPKRTATALFERCAAAGSAATAAPTRGWLSRKPEPEATAASVTVDLESYIVRVADYNPVVPGNVYLAAGGPGRADMVQFTAEQQKIASQNLQHSLASLAVYDVFFDTDGDLTFSDYTRIALLNRQGMVVVPSEASFIDYNRLLTFCEELKLLHSQSNNSGAKLLAVVWNKVNVQKHVPCLPVSSTLTPTKAVQELVGTLNQHLAQKVTMKYADLFVYPAPEDRDFAKFIEAVTMIVQDFALAGVAAQDLGMPFATMQPGMLHGGQMPYDIKADKLDRLKENIGELIQKIDNAPVQ